MNPFRLAWMEFARRRSSSVLSLAALSLAIATAGMLFRLSRLAEARFAGIARAGDAIIGAKAGGIEILLGCLAAEGPYPGFIPARLYWSLVNHEKLTATEGHPESAFHEALAPILYAGRFRGMPIIGTNAEFLKLNGRGFSISLAAGAWASGDGEAVLGAEAARRAHLRIGYVLQASPWPTAAGPGEWVVPYPLKVAGILSPMGNGWDRAAFTNLAEARRLLARAGRFEGSPWGDEVLNYMLIRMRPGRMDALRELVDARTVAQTVEVDATLSELYALTGAGRALGAAVALAVAVLASLCIAGLMIGAAEGKGREFAILRAVGYTGTELRAMALWQGAFLGLGAVIAGAGLDALCFPLLRRALGSGLPGPESVVSSPLQSAPIWIGLAIIALLASLIPYWRFTRTPPQQALQGLS